MTQPFRRSGWRYTFSHAFRSQSFLWKFALGTLLAGVVIGYAGGMARQPEPAKLGHRVLALSGVPLQEEDGEDEATPQKYDNAEAPDISPAFDQEISRPGIEFSDVLWAVPTLAPHASPKARAAMRESLRRRFSPEESELIFDYLSAWNRSDTSGLDRLRARSDRPDASRYANYVTGHIEMRRKNYQAAYKRFLKEGEREQAGESRQMAVLALVEAKDFTTLDELMADQRYKRYLSPYVSLEIAISRRDWRAILYESPRAQIASYRPDLLTVSLIACLAWAFFLGHLGELPRIFSKTSLLYLLAIGAGILSTFATIYLVILEENILHFSAGTDPVQILAYNIAGVALREEFCKLLLFLPLLPFLLRRKDELEALIAASFVGLGFAIEENCGYFLTSEASSGPGRFLTANFFHVALTGVNGLMLFRAFARGGARINDFLFIFPVTIVVHGIYDALPDLPEAEAGEFFAMIAYVLFSMYYFKHAHSLRSNVRMTIGLTGAFIIGCSVMAATAIAFSMINLGPGAGLTDIVPQLLGTAILLFMFFRVFDEQLAA